MGRQDVAGGEDSGELGVFGATSKEVCREHTESGREVLEARAICNWLADAELREFKETRLLVEKSWLSVRDTAVILAER